MAVTCDHPHCHDTASIVARDEWFCPRHWREHLAALENAQRR